MQFISQLSPPLSSEITVPGDKSISHRALIFGAIAEGQTHISGFLDGDDCMATLKAFEAMGVAIEGPFNQSVTIHGVGKYGLKAPQEILDCGNSGTSMRLMAGLLAAQSFDSTLTGDFSLLKRPMGRISKPLIQMGAKLTTHDEKPPIVIQGCQSLHGITYELAQASAQVKSCLLLAGMYASSKTTIIENEPSRDHTERMLKAFSYPLEVSGGILTIDAQSACKGVHVQVPGDISSAAFFIVAATLIPDSVLKIQNVGINPTRTGIISILQQMGASITIENVRTWGEEPVADLLIRSANLRGITIPIELVPKAIDEFPIICIAAALAKGVTTLHGAKELRVKESDRIGAMVDGLQILGIEAEAFEDGLTIIGGQLQGGVVDSRHDHRIAMAFAIAGALSKNPVYIRSCETVSTSFPGFIQLAQQLGMVLRETHDTF
jgi:3-phosphoshikimate 1-carboxyvinyltransferase